MTKRDYSVMINDELCTALTCSICLEIFSHPKQLPNCSHTFCCHCLESLISAALSVPTAPFVEFDCPNCRTKSVLPPGGVKALQGNIVAQQLVDKLNLERLAETQTENGMSQNELDRCSHVFNNSRQNCPHCNRRFCDRCMIQHVKNTRFQVVEMAEAVTKRIASMDMRQFETNVMLEVHRVEQDLKKQVAIIEAALIAESSRIMADAKAIANKRIDHVKASLVENCSLQRQISELKTKPELQISVEEIASLFGELIKQEKLIDEVQKLLTSAAPIDLKLETDSSFLATICNRWKVNLGKAQEEKILITGSDNEVIAPILNQNEEENKGNLVSTRSFYERMAIVITGSSKDAFGAPLRLPRRICSLNNDKVAVIHEQNRISIFQWNGRLTSTLKVFDPRKSKSELFVQDLAYDLSGNIFIVGDSGTMIGRIPLSPSAYKMPECVIPAIFARKAAHNFHGIAICSPKEELYVGEGPVIGIYNIREKIKLLSLPVNVAEPFVLSCVGDVECRIFYAGSSCDSISFIGRNDRLFKTIATKGGVLGDVHQVTGICFDEKGNMIVADAKNSRIQVFSSDNYVPLTGFSGEAANSKFKPFGVALLVSSPTGGVRIVVPDYSGQRICFYESRKTNTE